MLRKLTFILSIILIASAFELTTAAQTNGGETVSVNDSTLAAVNLPTGAHRVKDASVPKEIKDTLAKIVASGGNQVRQGDSEVVLWSGNYDKSNGSQMIKKLESVLQSSGWQYEIGTKQSDFVLFSLFRDAPERRLLVGFFVPSEDAFVFAMTEMVCADAPVPATETQVKETNVNVRNTGKINSGSSALIGKWSRGEGSGFIDYTGKTQYKAGATYSFEFSPDGTVEYIYDKDVLSIMQCRTKETSKARGTVNIAGDSMTINLGAMSSIGSSSCEPKNNFNKTLPASTVTKKFKIKKMESLARPDNPSIICFDGQDDNSCFEKSGK
jgi:hypothetical protein